MTIDDYFTDDFINAKEMSLKYPEFNLKKNIHKE